MTELEAFAKFTIEHGGEWWSLKESDSYTLCESKEKYIVKNQVYYNSPVFQIFDKKTGKRLFASTNYQHAYGKFQRLCKEG